MIAIRIAALAAVLTGTSIGLASQAFADDMTGSYNATATSAEGETKTVSWMLNPCGPDCRTLLWGRSVEEMHRQGTTWTSTDDKGCTTVVDEGTLVGTFQCPGENVLPIQVAKAG